jgi:cell division protein FtsL
MAYSSNSALAYDLDAYEPIQKKRKKPALRAVAPSRQAKAVAFTPGMLLSFAVVVTLVSVMVLNQLRLNEISGEINTLSGELQALESANAELSSELQAIVNLRTIEERAKSELGMQRLDQHQIETINLGQEDTIILTEDSPTVSIGEQIKTSILAAISGIQEYIGGE